jgi:transposase-like protein
MGKPGVRVRRTIGEKRRIVELTFEPGASVARVAQAEGVNSHQVFQWRRSYRQGGLALAGGSGPALLLWYVGLNQDRWHFEFYREIKPDLADAY